ncbi:aminoglycoside phosphotransferase (APT) family kinase protein [Flexivirga oryzae]|uniref:Aminoglycoside phosphotransferase (APT) family kinase protein n=2 Tax=Flexivirga oryzae TaxID=1794944 RepID=A0A839N501_9MICO|nr:aminoglycoside phosphotransferase (APT) family kinase protein [Flexivirga oryzae]
MMSSIRPWAEEVLQSAVVEEVPLTGGMSTALSVVTTASRRRAVLRQYPSLTWSPRRARRAAIGEALVLAALAGTEVPVPTLLGATADREDLAPAVLTSLCPGHRHSGSALEVAAELGRVLARIHSVAPIGGLADETTATVRSLRAGRPPRHGAPSALLKLVMQSVPIELETRRRVLVHNDFSVSNVLVDGDRITGVVDWTEAGCGNPGIDLGYAYVSTALSFGPPAAEELLRGYRSSTGWPVDDLSWWQLVAASRLEPDIDTWTSSANFLGPTNLTTAQVRDRFNALIDIAATRIRGNIK